MSGERIAFDPEPVAAIRDEVSRRGVEVRDLHDPLLRVIRTVRAGAGEFADELDTGAAGFELSWSVVLEEMSTSLGNVAANIGGLGLDLAAVDLDLSD